MTLRCGAAGGDRVGVGAGRTSSAAASLCWPPGAASGDLVDKGERFAQAYGLGLDGAVLVRPDAVVAWRAPTAAGDPPAAVEEALRRLLFRQP